MSGVEIHGRSGSGDVEMVEHQGYWEAVSRRYDGPLQEQRSLRARLREKKATHLLVDIRALTGFTPTTQEV
jgi:hypothetical protein